MTTQTLTAGKNQVTFKSFGADLAGDLYLPEGFEETKTYKAIVGASPFPQVKDQIPATYGPEMAAHSRSFGTDRHGAGLAGFTGFCGRTACQKPE